MPNISFWRVLLFVAAACSFVRGADQASPSEHELLTDTERRRAFEVGAWSVAGDVPSQQWFSMAYSQGTSSVLACSGYMLCTSNRPFTPGSVHFSTDNGNTWAQMPLSTSYAWTSCGISANGQVLVASAATAACNSNSEVNMRVYISTNGGADWTWANPSEDFGGVWGDRTLGPFTTVSETGQYIWVVDGTNTNTALAYSTDYGSTWTFPDNCVDATSTCTNQIGAIAMSTESDGQYVLMTNFNSYAAQLSTNAGSTWKQLTLPDSTSDMVGDGCAMSGSGQYMVVAKGTYYSSEVLKMYVSSDYGATFVTADFSSAGQSPQIFGAVAMSLSGLTIALASREVGSITNIIFMSYDGGVEWSLLSDPLTELSAITTLVMSGPAEYMMASNVQETAPVYVYQTNLTAYPTSWPTGAPTSAPSCLGGKEHGSSGSACYPCPKGYSSTAGGACEACGVGSYQDNTGSSECQTCSYPSSTVSTGATSEADCTALCFCVSSSTNAAIFATMCVLFALGMCLVDPKSATSGGFTVFQQHLIVFGHLAIPVSDVFTDLAYMFNTRFYHPVVLAFLFASFAHPTMFFLHKLVQLRAAPGLFFSYRKWFWLGYNKTSRQDKEHGDIVPFSTCNGERIVPLPHHDNIVWLALEILIWIGAVAAQLITAVCFFFFLPAHLCFLAFWLVLGMFLHMSKLLTVNRVWNLWFYVWTLGDPDFWVTYDSSDGFLIDTEELNSALYLQFICGSFPQVILQTANNTLLGEWDALSIFSVLISGGMCLNSIYRYFYYTMLRKTKLSMRDVPVTTMFIPDIPPGSKHLPRLDKTAAPQLKEQEMKPKLETTNEMHAL